MRVRSRLCPMVLGVLTTVVVVNAVPSPPSAAAPITEQPNESSILDAIRDTVTALVPIDGEVRNELIADARHAPLPPGLAPDWDETAAYRLPAGRSATITPLTDADGAIAILFDADGAIAHHIETSATSAPDATTSLTTSIDRRSPATHHVTADDLRAATRDILLKKVFLGPGCWAAAATAILATLLVIALIPLNLIPFFGNILYSILAAALLMTWIPVIPACLGL
ncbi:hypothetical protein NDR87_25500 [Nocardia sp. CDC159]|uniref:Membrane transport protein MMPL domain-containing protein n=1 Tax=Nocardia pulmonis TaxID=2951408 RepID=A0A9X2E704_9NOCA|nr:MULTISPECIES: hypothetical protein [Nocardia]MCM6774800.1 hypothetical protein [Nocardia pulmonis]MCM6789731.1 hypothetical protein [Nocardia sp. CDC159]